MQGVSVSSPGRGISTVLSVPRSVHCDSKMHLKIGRNSFLLQPFRIAIQIILSYVNNMAASAV
jgi:hypothetical protein